MNQTPPEEKTLTYQELQKQLNGVKVILQQMRDDYAGKGINIEGDVNTFMGEVSKADPKVFMFISLRYEAIVLRQLMAKLKPDALEVILPEGNA